MAVDTVFVIHSIFSCSCVHTFDSDEGWEEWSLGVTKNGAFSVLDSFGLNFDVVASLSVDLCEIVVSDVAVTRRFIEEGGTLVAINDRGGVRGEVDRDGDNLSLYNRPVVGYDAFVEVVVVAETVVS